MSNCFWNNVVAFVVGAAVGAVATLKYIEYKQNRMEEEEIAKAEEAGIPVEEDGIVLFDSEKENDTPRDGMRLYHKIASEYNNDEEVAPVEKKEEVKTEEVENVERPYVIAPEEFGELDGYRRISLQYFADGYLADEMNNLVDPIVGINPERHFGEYEDDSVFVRDDSRKVDYEILKDLRNYCDICMPKRRGRR